MASTLRFGQPLARGDDRERVRVERRGHAAEFPCEEEFNTERMALRCSDERVHVGDSRRELQRSAPAFGPDRRAFRLIHAFFLTGKCAGEFYRPPPRFALRRGRLLLRASRCGAAGSSSALRAAARQAPPPRFALPPSRDASAGQGGAAASPSALRAPPFARRFGGTRRRGRLLLRASRFHLRETLRRGKAARQAPPPHLPLPPSRDASVGRRG